jgi:hypothetical protein
MVVVAPAGAIVQTIESKTVGLQPRNGSSFIEGNGALGANFDNANGNPVLHSTNTYAIYWDPTDHYHGDWQHLINRFFQNFGADSGRLSNVFAVDAQYTDRTNQPATYHSTFRGAFTDTTKYPGPGCTDPEPLVEGDAITCLSDQQIRDELVKFVIQHDLPKGMNTLFYLLTPPGVTVCVDAGGSTGHCSDSEPSPSTSYSNSFCSYHSAVNPTNPTNGDGNTILYAMIPWTAGGAGDYHLAVPNRVSGTDCQDGGFDPSKGEEKREKAKEITEAEEKAFEEETKEQKQKTEEERALEGPHIEEPNQIGLGPDGSYDTGLADLIINQIAVEQQNTVTNPLLNAWQDPANNESTDECRNFFNTAEVVGSVTGDLKTGAGSLSNSVIGGNAYYLNTAFNYAAALLPYPAIPCIGGVSLVPDFTVANSVNSGELVGFDGMESDVTLNAAVGYAAGGAEQPNYAVYTWNFGDGTPTVSGYAPGAPTLNSPSASPCEAPWLSPCAASAYHSYQYGGTYEVTLTVKDVANNVAQTTKSITVAGPPPPQPPAPTPPVAPGTSAGGATSSTTGAGAAGAGAGSHSNPVATQAVVSHNLPAVLRSGLVVRYSVNEQVAGRFEVLLASSIARRLGLHGARATGLAKNLPPQTVIAKAVLVTTKGGRSTFKILFGKTTAARLRRLKNVSLMIRLSVHNAASGTTSVLNTVKLTH